MNRNAAIQLDTSVKIASKSTLTVVNRFSAGGQLHRWGIWTVMVGCHPSSWQNDQTTSLLLIIFKMNQKCLYLAQQV